MTAPGRAACPVCRRSYRLRADGTVRHHPDYTARRGPCPGVGQHPARPLLAEDVPTGRFGGPRPSRPPDSPDPDAARHRATLAAALRTAA